MPGVCVCVCVGVRPAGSEAEAARDGGRSSESAGGRSAGGVRVERGRGDASGTARQRSAHVGHHFRQRSLVALALRLPAHSAQKVRTVPCLPPVSDTTPYTVNNYPHIRGY